MPWVILTDDLAIHSKVNKLRRKCGEHALAAWGLHLLALSYSARTLTDGLLSEEFFEEIEHDWKVPPEVMADIRLQLAETGLWDATEQGPVIHDYLDHNDSREQVEAKRGAKKAASSKGGIQSGKARAQKKQAGSDKEADTKRTGSAKQAEDKQAEPPYPYPYPSPSPSPDPNPNPNPAAVAVAVRRGREHIASYTTTDNDAAHGFLLEFVERRGDAEIGNPEYKAQDLAKPEWQKTCSELEAKYSREDLSAALGEAIAEAGKAPQFRRRLSGPAAPTVFAAAIPRLLGGAEKARAAARIQELTEKSNARHMKEWLGGDDA